MHASTLPGDLMNCRIAESDSLEPEAAVARRTSNGWEAAGGGEPNDMIGVRWLWEGGGEGVSAIDAQVRRKSFFFAFFLC